VTLLWGWSRLKGFVEGCSSGDEHGLEEGCSLGNEHGAVAVTTTGKVWWFDSNPDVSRLLLHRGVSGQKMTLWVSGMVVEPLVCWEHKWSYGVGHPLKRLWCGGTLLMKT
jgi:hypothetical protein